MNTCEDMQKHTFDVKAFRKQRLPLLLISILPSILADGYLIYGLAMQLNGFPFPPQAGGVLNVAAPFALNLIFLKAPFILWYSRVRTMRLGSYVNVLTNQVLYRMCKLRPFSKIDSGYAYHDDYYISNITSIRRKQNGALVVTGTIKAIRKQHGIEAIMRERTFSRMTIPAYFMDMSGIETKLNFLLK